MSVQKLEEGVVMHAEVRDDKFIVFHRDEFLAWFGDLAKGTETPEIIQDAVVIRRQDHFSPPALDAYSSAIQAAVIVIESGDGPTDKTKHLQDIADYFHEQAALAWETHRKIPD